METRPRSSYNPDAVPDTRGLASPAPSPQKMKLASSAFASQGSTYKKDLDTPSSIPIFSHGTSVKANLFSTYSGYTQARSHSFSQRQAQTPLLTASRVDSMSTSIPPISPLRGADDSSAQFLITGEPCKPRAYTTSMPLEFSMEAQDAVADYLSHTYGAKSTESPSSRPLLSSPLPCPFKSLRREHAFLASHFRLFAARRHARLRATAAPYAYQNILPLPAPPTPPAASRKLSKLVVGAIFANLNVSAPPPDAPSGRCLPLQSGVDTAFSADEEDYQSRSSKEIAEDVAVAVGTAYSTVATKLKLKTVGDVCVEELRKVCLALRKAAKMERVLLHFSSFGVPRITAAGELWAFNREVTQYMPLRMADLYEWVKGPALIVYDGPNGGRAVNAWVAAAKSYYCVDGDERTGRARGATVAGRGATRSGSSSGIGSGAGGRDSARTIIFDDNYVFSGCEAHEDNVLNPRMPQDIYTSFLLNPLASVLLVLSVNYDMQDITPQLLASICSDNAPGSPMRALKEALDAIVDAVAWDCLHPLAFQRILRGEPAISALARSHILACKYLSPYGSTPASHPCVFAAYSEVPCAPVAVPTPAGNTIGATAQGSVPGSQGQGSGQAGNPALGIPAPSSLPASNSGSAPPVSTMLVYHTGASAATRAEVYAHPLWLSLEQMLHGALKVIVNGIDYYRQRLAITIVNNASQANDGGNGAGNGKEHISSDLPALRKPVFPEMTFFQEYLDLLQSWMNTSHLHLPADLGASEILTGTAASSSTPTPGNMQHSGQNSSGTLASGQTSYFPTSSTQSTASPPQEPHIPATPPYLCLLLHCFICPSTRARATAIAASLSLRSAHWAAACAQIGLMKFSRNLLKLMQSQEDTTPGTGSGTVLGDNATTKETMAVFLCGLAGAGKEYLPELANSEAASVFTRVLRKHGQYWEPDTSHLSAMSMGVDVGMGELRSRDRDSQRVSGNRGIGAGADRSSRGTGTRVSLTGCTCDVCCGLKARHEPTNTTTASTSTGALSTPVLEATPTADAATPGLKKKKKKKKVVLAGEERASPVSTPAQPALPNLSSLPALPGLGGSQELGGMTGLQRGPTPTTAMSVTADAGEGEVEGDAVGGEGAVVEKAVRRKGKARRAAAAAAAANTEARKEEAEGVGATDDVEVAPLPLLAGLTRPVGAIRPASALAAGVGGPGSDGYADDRGLPAFSVNATSSAPFTTSNLDSCIVAEVATPAPPSFGGVCLRHAEAFPYLASVAALDVLDTSGLSMDTHVHAHWLARMPDGSPTAAQQGTGARTGAKSTPWRLPSRDVPSSADMRHGICGLHAETHPECVALSLLSSSRRQQLRVATATVKASANMSGSNSNSNSSGSGSGLGGSSSAIAIHGQKYGNSANVAEAIAPEDESQWSSDSSRILAENHLSYTTAALVMHNHNPFYPHLFVKSPSTVFFTRLSLHGGSGMGMAASSSDGHGVGSGIQENTSAFPVAGSPYPTSSTRGHGYYDGYSDYLDGSHCADESAADEDVTLLDLETPLPSPLAPPPLSSVFFAVAPLLPSTPTLYPSDDVDTHSLDAALSLSYLFPSSSVRHRVWAFDRDTARQYTSVALLSYFASSLSHEAFDAWMDAPYDDPAHTCDAGVGGTAHSHSHTHGYGRGYGYNSPVCGPKACRSFSDRPDRPAYDRADRGDRGMGSDWDLYSTPYASGGSSGGGGAVTSWNSSAGMGAASQTMPLYCSSSSTHTLAPRRGIPLHTRSHAHSTAFSRRAPSPCPICMHQPCLCCAAAARLKAMLACKAQHLVPGHLAASVGSYVTSSLDHPLVAAHDVLSLTFEPLDAAKDLSRRSNVKHKTSSFSAYIRGRMEPGAGPVFPDCHAASPPIMVTLLRTIDALCAMDAETLAAASPIVALDAPFPGTLAEKRLFAYLLLDVGFFSVLHRMAMLAAAPTTGNDLVLCWIGIVLARVLPLTASLQTAILGMGIVDTYVLRTLAHNSPEVRAACALVLAAAVKEPVLKDSCGVWEDRVGAYVPALVRVQQANAQKAVDIVCGRCACAHTAPEHAAVAAKELASPLLPLLHSFLASAPIPSLPSPPAALTVSPPATSATPPLWLHPLSPLRMHLEAHFATLLRCLATDASVLVRCEAATGLAHYAYRCRSALRGILAGSASARREVLEKAVQLNNGWQVCVDRLIDVLRKDDEANTVCVDGSTASTGASSNGNPNSNARGSGIGNANGNGLGIGMLTSPTSTGTDCSTPTRLPGITRTLSTCLSAASSTNSTATLAGNGGGVGASGLSVSLGMSSRLSNAMAADSAVHTQPHTQSASHHGISIGNPRGSGHTLLTTTTSTQASNNTPKRQATGSGAGMGVGGVAEDCELRLTGHGHGTLGLSLHVNLNDSYGSAGAGVGLHGAAHAADHHNGNGNVGGNDSRGSGIGDLLNLRASGGHSLHCPSPHDTTSSDEYPEVIDGVVQPHVPRARAIELYQQLRLNFETAMLELAVHMHETHLSVSLELAWRVLQATSNDPSPDVAVTGQYIDQVAALLAADSAAATSAPPTALGKWVSGHCFISPARWTVLAAATSAVTLPEGPAPAPTLIPVGSMSEATFSLTSPFSMSSPDAPQRHSLSAASPIMQTPSSPTATSSLFTPRRPNVTLRKFFGSETQFSPPPSILQPYLSAMLMHPLFLSLLCPVTAAQADLAAKAVAQPLIKPQADAQNNFGMQNAGIPAGAASPGKNIPDFFWRSPLSGAFSPSPAPVPPIPLFSSPSPLPSLPSPTVYVSPTVSPAISPAFAPLSFTPQQPAPSGLVADAIADALQAAHERGDMKEHALLCSLLVAQTGSATTDVVPSLSRPALASVAHCTYAGTRAVTTLLSPYVSEDIHLHHRPLALKSAWPYAAPANSLPTSSGNGILGLTTAPAEEVPFATRYDVAAEEMRARGGHNRLHPTHGGYAVGSSYGSELYTSPSGESSYVNSGAAYGANTYGANAYGTGPSSLYPSLVPGYTGTNANGGYSSTVYSSPPAGRDLKFGISSPSGNVFSHCSPTATLSSPVLTAHTSSGAATATPGSSSLTVPLHTSSSVAVSHNTTRALAAIAAFHHTAHMGAYNAAQPLVFPTLQKEQPPIEVLEADYDRTLSLEHAYVSQLLLNMPLTLYLTFNDQDEHALEHQRRAGFLTSVQAVVAKRNTMRRAFLFRSAYVASQRAQAQGLHASMSALSFGSAIADCGRERRLPLFAREDDGSIAVIGTGVTVSLSRHMEKQAAKVLLAMCLHGRTQSRTYSASLSSPPLRYTASHSFPGHADIAASPSTWQDRSLPSAFASTPALTHTPSHSHAYTHTRSTAPSLSLHSRYSSGSHTHGTHASISSTPLPAFATLAAQWSVPVLRADTATIQLFTSLIAALHTARAHAQSLAQLAKDAPVALQYFTLDAAEDLPDFTLVSRVRSSATTAGVMGAGRCGNEGSGGSRDGTQEIGGGTQTAGAGAGADRSFLSLSRARSSALSMPAPVDGNAASSTGTIPGAGINGGSGTGAGVIAEGICELEVCELDDIVMPYASRGRSTQAPPVTRATIAVPPSSKPDPYQHYEAAVRGTANSVGVSGGMGGATTVTITTSAATTGTALTASTSTTAAAAASAAPSAAANAQSFSASHPRAQSLLQKQRPSTATTVATSASRIDSPPHHPHTTPHHSHTFSLSPTRVKSRPDDSRGLNTSSTAHGGCYRGCRNDAECLCHLTALTGPHAAAAQDLYLLGRTHTHLQTLLASTTGTVSNSTSKREDPSVNTSLHVPDDDIVIITTPSITAALPDATHAHGDPNVRADMSPGVFSTSSYATAKAEVTDADTSLRDELSPPFFSPVSSAAPADADASVPVAACPSCGDDVCTCNVFSSYPRDVWEEQLKAGVGLEEVHGVHGHPFSQTVLAWGDTDMVTLSEVITNDTGKEKLKTGVKWRATASNALANTNTTSSNTGTTTGDTPNTTPMGACEWLVPGSHGAQGSLIAFGTDTGSVHIWRVDGDMQPSLATAFSLPFAKAAHQWARSAPTAAPSPRFAASNTSGPMSGVRDAALELPNSQGRTYAPRSLMAGTVGSIVSGIFSGGSTISPQPQALSSSASTLAPASVASSTRNHSWKLCMSTSAVQGTIATGFGPAISLFDCVSERTTLTLPLLDQGSGSGWWRDGHWQQSMDGNVTLGSMHRHGLSLYDAPRSHHAVKSVTQLAAHLLLVAQGAGVALVDTRTGSKVAFTRTHATDIAGACAFRGGIDQGEIVCWNTAGQVRVMDFRVLCAHPVPVPLYSNGTAFGSSILGSAVDSYADDDVLWGSNASSIYDSSLCRTLETGEGLLGVSTHNWASMMAVQHKQSVSVLDSKGKGRTIKTRKGFMALTTRRQNVRGVSWCSDNNAVVVAYNHDVAVAARSKGELAD